VEAAMPVQTTTPPIPIPLAPADAPSTPAHVPPHLIRDLRFANGETANDLPDPYTPCDVLRAPGVPRIMYYPWPVAGMGRGGWVVTRHEDIRRVYEDHDLFSTRGVAQFQALAGETFPSIPLGVDPPDHRRYRMFLNPFFAPVAMNDMEPKIRAAAVEMIDKIAGNGEVDIAWDFGRVYPVRIFLDLMGFPFSMFEQFLAWEWEILHNKDVTAKVTAVKDVLAYLRGFIA
jgi:cytochrome P450